MFIKFTFKIPRGQHRESKQPERQSDRKPTHAELAGALSRTLPLAVWQRPALIGFSPRVGAIPTWTSPPLTSAGVKHQCASFFSSIWPNNVSRRVEGARDATRLHRYWSTYSRATRLQDVGLRHSRRDALEARFRSATLPVDGWSNFMLCARNIAIEPQLDRYE